jgi:MYXO-CTERM domain-containing protein
MRKIISSAFAGLLILASSANATFSDQFDLGTAASYTNSSGSFGNWTYSITTNSGSGYVSTQSAPDTLTMNSNSTLQGQGLSTVVTLTCAPVNFDGTISFDVDSMNGLNVRANSVAVSSSGANFSFNLGSGESFSITLSAMGGTFILDPVTLMPMQMPGSNYTTTISNFSAISSVPEPSTYALGAGVAALALAGFARRRSRKA